MNKLHLGFKDICDIYAEALEKETGMPVDNLANVFDYDSYNLNYDSLTYEGFGPGKTAIIIEALILISAGG